MYEAFSRLVIELNNFLHSRRFSAGIIPAHVVATLVETAGLDEQSSEVWEKLRLSP